jgi:hypothetical protein
VNDGSQQALYSNEESLKARTSLPPFLNYFNYLPIFVPLIANFSGPSYGFGRFAGVRGPMAKFGGWQ